jgi:hydroxyacylglutathione hydrolase
LKGEQDLIESRVYDLLANAITKGMHLHPIPTDRIAEHVYAVRTGTVNFFIYEEKGCLIAIDAGFGKSIIRREMKRIGIDPLDITDLFLTHSDFDHAGGVPVFGDAQVYLSRQEEPLVTHRQARMWGFVHNRRLDRPYHLLDDNDVISIGSLAVQAIATPGHTSGSMSYLVNGSILFVGDTFKLIDDRVHPKRRYINMDTEAQKTSIQKLARLQDIRLACTAHNGYTEKFEDAICMWKVMKNEH